MLELIGLIVTVLVVTMIVDALISDDMDFVITNGKGKVVFEYHKHDQQKDDKKNKKDLKDSSDL